MSITWKPAPLPTRKGGREWTKEAPADPVREPALPGSKALSLGDVQHRPLPREMYTHIHAHVHTQT